ncbi:hypothetical protein IMZ48_27750, partial [Candidatus Bathyarchaeota archaeon]|nr:hypothetical protein [Candidatus Bathyarchaeota archaeon]
MNAWAKAFSLHNKVRLVRMVQNGIRPEGISHLLAEGLNKAAGLRVFNIQDNTFTLSGAKALAKAVQGWPELQELGVSDCYLTAKGWAHVSQALAKGQNAKLEVLRLAYNDITAPGVKSLSEAAEKLPSIRRIELNGNKFAEGDPSIVKLQELLEERKEKLAGDVVMEDDWGLDELDELDSEVEEESEEEEEEEEVEELAE